MDGHRSYATHRWANATPPVMSITLGIANSNTSTRDVRLCEVRYAILQTCAKNHAQYTRITGRQYMLTQYDITVNHHVTRMSDTSFDSRDMCSMWFQYAQHLTS
jgi:hypothetical protein